MKIRKLIFCFALFFTFSKASFAADNVDVNYDNIGKAISGLYSKTGEVTKEDYENFWNEIGAKDLSAKEKIITFVKNNILPMQDYQRATWKCAGLAWNSQKTPQCPDLQKKYDILAVSFKKNNQENQLKTITEFSQNIIESAAKRGSLKSEGGIEIPLSLEMIQMMNKNLNGIFSRFEAVLKTSY